MPHGDLMLLFIFYNRSRNSQEELAVNHGPTLSVCAAPTRVNLPAPLHQGSALQKQRGGFPINPAFKKEKEKGQGESLSCLVGPDFLFFFFLI